MSFDIDLVMCEMLKEIKDTVNGNWFDVKSAVRQILENEKDALEHLAEERFLNNISEDELKSRLEDEQYEVVVEMLEDKVFEKEVAQRAAKAAIDKFFSAIQAA